MCVFPGQAVSGSTKFYYGCLLRNQTQADAYLSNIQGETGRCILSPARAAESSQKRGPGAASKTHQRGVIVLMIRKTLSSWL